jgi:hypothetical protein
MERISNISVLRPTNHKYKLQEISLRIMIIWDEISHSFDGTITNYDALILSIKHNQPACKENNIEIS